MSEINEISVACQEAAKIFNISNLRFGQQEALAAVLEGQDVSIILPTGAGKSICYQLFPLVFQKLKGRIPMVLVVQPLTRLIEEQAGFLNKVGISACHFGSTQTNSISYERAMRGEFTFRKFKIFFFFFFFFITSIIKDLSIL